MTADYRTLSPTLRGIVIGVLAEALQSLDTALESWPEQAEWLLGYLAEYGFAILPPRGDQSGSSEQYRDDGHGNSLFRPEAK